MFDPDPEPEAELDEARLASQADHEARAFDEKGTESITVERIGEGLLVSLSNGANIHFTDLDIARQLATNILMVCAFGRDQIDTLTTDIDGDSNT